MALPVQGVEGLQGGVQVGPAGIHGLHRQGRPRLAADRQAAGHVPAVRPAKGGDHEVIGQREVGHAVVQEQGVVCLQSIVDGDAAHDDGIDDTCHGHLALLCAVPGVGHIGPPVFASVDGQGFCSAVPRRGQAHKPAQVVGHGYIGDVVVHQQRVPGGAAVNLLPVHHHRSCGDGGGHPLGLGGGGEAYEQQNTAETGEYSFDYHGGLLIFFVSG